MATGTKEAAELDLSIFASDTAKAKPDLRREQPIERIRIDGGTQQRPIDTALVAEYAEVIDDLPPIQTIFDGKDYWLWNGFHRYHAFLKAGRTHINFYANKGTLDDAIGLSFSANKTSGARRQAGVVRDIILKILSDDRWKRATAAQIAAHVGASQRYVETVKAEAKEGARPLPDSDGKRTVTRGGKSYEMNTGRIGRTAAAEAKANKATKDETNGEAAQPAAPETPPEPVIVKDELGQVIEDEGIAAVFARLDELRLHCRAISKMKGEVMNAIAPESGKPDPLYEFVDPSVKSDFANLYGTLKAGYPFALCPVHPADKLARKDCKWCHGKGWVNERQYKLATDAGKEGGKGK